MNTTISYSMNSVINLADNVSHFCKLENGACQTAAFLHRMCEFILKELGNAEKLAAKGAFEEYCFSINEAAQMASYLMHSVLESEVEAWKLFRELNNATT